MTTQPGPLPNRDPGRVLVVDDHPLNRLLMRDALEKAGYEVREADGGEAALAMVSPSTTDVVLLDVMMPGMDGFEVCRRLKGAPHTNTLPILLVTALTDRENRLKGIEAGANDFISKPLDTVDLLLRVRNAVMTKRLYAINDMSRPLSALSSHLEALEAAMGTRAAPEALEHLGAARRSVADLRTVLAIANAISHFDATS
jgi:CheY-like chemotaxis protein